jgi:hypothetical protein
MSMKQAIWIIRALTVLFVLIEILSLSASLHVP